MLELVELRRLFERLGTPPEGRKLIEEARRTAPVRQVRSTSNNVITRFNSRKMDRMVDTESRTVEYPAVVMYEHDPKVLEFYAQPVHLDLLVKEEGKLKPFRIQHVPDFLVVREEGIWVEEWREEKRLISLQAKYPGRFFKDASGWRYPPIEAHLGDLGISYRLRSALEHPRIYIQNLVFLADYLSEACPPVDDFCLEAIHLAFRGQAGLPLLHLIQRGVEGERGFTADHVYKAIADQDVFFDLQGEILSETNRVMVYRDASALQLAKHLAIEEHATLSTQQEISIRQGAVVDYDGATYTVVRVGAETATLQNPNCTFEQRLSVLTSLFQQGSILIHPTTEERLSRPCTFEQLTPRAVDEVLTRMKWLELAETDPQSVPRSTRTLQRYRRLMRMAGGTPSDQKLALVSRISERGNRTRRISLRMIELVDEVADKHYNRPKNIKKTSAYRYFKIACEEEGITPCSLPAFIKELEGRASTRLRKGKRAAYQEEPIVWYLVANEPLHGVRPFQYVHIDHTQLDVLLVAGESRKVLGKAWLTLALDAESRHILGYYLSFDPPSYCSCMMVLRDVVRRYGQMPWMLVLDNGKEFHSRALSHLCERHGCSIRFRPAGKPRYGSVMERIFGTTNSQFIHLLEGNTQLMKNPRSVTKSVLPENFAAWTMPQLHGALDYFFFEIYAKNEHPAHGEAPLEHFQRRLNETGERLHRLVRFDEIFRIETCPPPQDGPTRVVTQRGVKIQFLHFWNDAMHNLELRGKTVEVRMDPWDPGTAFVLFKDRWLVCRSKLRPMLSRYTETERRYLFQEMAALMGGQIRGMGEHRLAEWLKVLEPKNFDPKLAERQNQGKELYASMEMAQAVATSEPDMREEAGRLVARPAVEPLKPDRVEEPDDYSLF